MLAGNLTEVKFDWPEGMKSGDDSPNSHSSWAEHTQMKVISETTLNVNQVAYINGRLIIFYLSRYQIVCCLIMIGLPLTRSKQTRLGCIEWKIATTAIRRSLCTCTRRPTRVVVRSTNAPGAPAKSRSLLPANSANVLRTR